MREIALRIGVFFVAALLFYLLRIPGLLIGLFLVLGVFLATRQDLESPELNALRTSIRLSADDIREVLGEYDTFLHSEDTDAVADRTLHRPELANPDSVVPEVETFQFHYHQARRFLTRLEPRLLSPRRTSRELEQLLRITDERAATIRESWWQARRAAQLGTSQKASQNPNQNKDSGGASTSPDNPAED